MRALLTISLPPQKKKEIEKRAFKLNKSTSAYIRYALELEQHFISEDDLVRMASQAEDAFQNGKTKQLKSLADLMR